MDNKTDNDLEKINGQLIKIVMEAEIERERHQRTG